MIWPFHKILKPLQPFVGKAIPDVPEVVEPTKQERSRRELVLEWQDTALKMARQAGRVRKGNAFSFTMSDVRQSVTVPEATFDLFVAAGIIDEKGNFIR